MNRLDNDCNVAALLHQPATFSSRSGMYPLAEALGATPIYYRDTYKTVMETSWRLGHWLRCWGTRYYGSQWNSLCPVIDEYRLSRVIRQPYDVIHFLWGEFGSPRKPGLFRKHARALVGTFHASASRLPRVLSQWKTADAYDGITLMSEAQVPFFVEQGMAPDRMRVILHGVDTKFYMPSSSRREREPNQPLKGLLVGKTERDHAFMAQVLQALPAGVLSLTLLTAEEQRRAYYQEVPGVEVPGFLDDEALRTAYQQADILCMPMLDCAANNVVLESMACGTPVLTNRVGGIPEYVSPESNFIMESKSVAAWVDLLVAMKEDDTMVSRKRGSVRDWAERFDWHSVAEGYIRFYRYLLGEQ